MKQILAVDDEPYTCNILEETFKVLPNVRVQVRSTGRCALDYLHANPCDLLVTDLSLPDVSRAELLHAAQAKNTAMLVLTACPSIEDAIEAMRMGAHDYIAKPFVPEELLHKAKRLLCRPDVYRLEQSATPGFAGIIGQSPQIQQVFQLIRRVAHSEIDLLIYGETGTGKELVAQAIHEYSSRANAHFVPVDCGAIPEHLMESEFFGYERGAFTGAQSRQKGLLEYSDQGTFFLDEIGELPLLMQAKLLRVLQERKVRRLGGKSEIPFSTRVIAATRRDLKQEVEEGRFREDLYFRINTLVLELPPLRARGCDIQLLASHFLSMYRHESPYQPVDFTEEVRQIFTSYPWPGNIRELQNVVRHAIAMTNHEFIDPSALPPIISSYGAPCTQPIFTVPGLSWKQLDADFNTMRNECIEQFERCYLRFLLQKYHGQVPRITEESGLSRSTLYRLLNKHGFDIEAYRSSG